MVSIIVPIYNSGDKLRTCLNSIKLQSYHDIEVLMVNDGSKDNSSVICEEFAKDDNRFIDIQIPLSGVEVMGYTPREDLPEAEYNADKDISFYHGLAESYIPVKPGMFVIFFPQDAHAPGVTPDGVKKVIVKVLV